MSHALLRDESYTIFTAGHETTANALTFALYLLARHPDAEAALHGELSRVLEGRLVAAEDVEKLTYTRKVLAEAMRLYPPAWGLGREAKVDVEIGGHVVPKGSVVLLSQWVTHRDERWYPNPAQFEPFALDAARTSQAPALVLLPLRRRVAPVHRRKFCLDGSNPGTGHDRPILARGVSRSKALACLPHDHAAATARGTGDFPQARRLIPRIAWPSVPRYPIRRESMSNLRSD